MAILRYAHPMTGVRVPRSEVLNARPWAIVKLIGFVIACLAMIGLLLLGGAMLAGARINFHAPAGTLAPPPSIPAAPPVVLVPPPPAPAPPVVAQIAPAASTPAALAPASSDEALEQAYKRKLLEEGDP